MARAIPAGIVRVQGRSRGKRLPRDHGRSINVSLGMPDATKCSQRLRDQAERCRRLARAEAEETHSDRRYSRE